MDKTRGLSSVLGPTVQKVVPGGGGDVKTRQACKDNSPKALSACSHLQFGCFLRESWCLCSRR